MIGYDLSDQMVRCCTGFGGGIGSSHLGMCGGLTGGTVLIGAIHGRAEASEDYRRCNELTKKYFDAFSNLYGCTICEELQQKIKKTDGIESCRPMLRRTATILAEILTKG